MSANLIVNYSSSPICHSVPNRTKVSFLQNLARATVKSEQGRQIPLLKIDRRNLLLGLGSLTLISHPNTARAATESKKLVGIAEFPTALDSVISVMVPRPKRSRSKKEKEKEEEVLSIEGIEFVADKAVKFDVHVNDDEDDLSGAGESKFAGSLVFLPQSNKTVRTSLHLGITDLLENLGADGDKNIKVTLVPQIMQRPVTIGRIKIEYFSD